MQTLGTAGEKRSRQEIKTEVEQKALMSLIPLKLVVGRNYHTSWQAERGMRFILKQLSGDKALLGTMYNSKTYWVDIKQLRDTRKNHINDLWELSNKTK